MRLRESAPHRIGGREHALAFAGHEKVADDRQAPEQRVDAEGRHNDAIETELALLGRYPTARSDAHGRTRGSQAGDIDAAVLNLQRRLDIGEQDALSRQHVG